jgi:putative ABC transport system permease protein
MFSRRPPRPQKTQPLRQRLTGALVALAVTRVLAGYLFGVTGHDPLTFVAVAGISIAVAIVACAIPALKAIRVDPMVALRYE